MQQGVAARVQAVRDQFHIICEGHHIPPAITNFHDMKFPKPILDELDGKGITKPTPIQARHPHAAAATRLVPWIALWTPCVHIVPCSCLPGWEAIVLTGFWGRECDAMSCARFLCKHAVAMPLRHVMLTLGQSGYMHGQGHYRAL